jgi:hypothetical protein
MRFGREAAGLQLENQLSTVGPLRLCVVERQPFVEGQRGDFLLDLEWSGEAKRFAAEYKSIGTPETVRRAAQQAIELAAHDPSWHPLVVVPHLSSSSFEVLLESGISGFDLSGNYVVQADHWFVYRADQPNRFPSDATLKNAYRGKSALVGRLLLSAPVHDQVTHVHERVEARGGVISLSLVSKALSALEEDLIVDKSGGTIRLVQPERLLDKLEASYAAPSVRSKRTGEAAPSRLVSTDAALNATKLGLRVALWDDQRFVVAPTVGERVRIYTSKPSSWAEELGFAETNRFANVELIETKEPGVFFDTDLVEGFPRCSKLEVYLQLSRGDKRERQAAEPLRVQILDEARRHLR